MIKDKKLKNIALFVGKLTGGGAERAVGRLSIALSKYYNVFIFIYNPKNLDYEYGGTIIDLANNSNSFPMMAIKSALNINRAIKKNNIELLISFLDMPNMINGFINKSCKKIISIRVYYERGHFFTLNDKVKYPLIKKSIEKADGVMVLSEKQKRILIRDMKVKREDVFVVPNLFDINEIRQKAQLPAENAMIVNFMNPFSTIAVGRLDYQKNYKKLFEIFKIVKSRIPQANLLVLGTGNMKSELETYISELGLENDICLAGRVSNPFSYMANAKVYVSLSRFEGFPNSLVEAMVCGLPVMHSNCPTGPEEILAENKKNIKMVLPTEADSGILLPVFEPGAFKDESSENLAKEKCADVWCRLLNDSELHSYYVKKSKQRAMMYDVERGISQYVKIIDSMIEE